MFGGIAATLLIQRRVTEGGLFKSSHGDVEEDNFLIDSYRVAPRSWRCGGGGQVRRGIN